MGIELGSIGSAVGGVASAVDRGVSSVGQMSAEAGPVVGSIGRIVNEGPAVSLEGFKPMGISDIGALDFKGGSYQPSFSLAGEILFKAGPQINEVDVVAEAETILAQVQKPATLPLVARNNKLVEPMATPVAIPNIVEYPQPQAVVLPESRISVEVTPAVLTQPAVQEQETVEEIVTEKVIKKETDLIEEEEITKEKRLYLVDESALTQRIHEIRQAVNRARIEAKRLGLGESIDGSLVAKFMPAEHAGNRSSIVQPNGPDGSYEETKETVKIGQFYSEDQVEDVVLENRPVKIGKDGKPVKNEDVRKVLKHWTVKLTTAHEVVIERIVKKESTTPHQTVFVSPVVEQPPKAEPSLEDHLALAEVFQKAART